MSLSSPPDRRLSAPHIGTCWVMQWIFPPPIRIVTEEECRGLDPCWDQPSRRPGERLAASYVNFYIANGSIVMPGFGDPADREAREILQGLFPERKVHIPLFLSPGQNHMTRGGKGADIVNVTVCLVIVNSPGQPQHHGHSQVLPQNVLNLLPLLL